MILKRYLSHLESCPVDRSHYVFRALSKTRSGDTLVSVNKPISYSSVRDVSFKSTCKDSAHSLRAGGASAAANAGVAYRADRLSQSHGRWKSVSAKNGYVEDSLESRLLVSKNLEFSYLVLCFICSFIPCFINSFSLSLSLLGYIVYYE